jgi:hypothetical protein
MFKTVSISSPVKEHSFHNNMQEISDLRDLQSRLYNDMPFLLSYRV